MPASFCASSADLRASVAEEGFAFVRGHAMREMLAPYGTLADWTAFCESWNALGLDPYMADGGRYRRRRHAVFAAPRDGAITRAPHQPHYQSLSYNPLHGGIERWFEPVLDEIGAGATMRTVLAYCHATFSALCPATSAWRLEVHQFRIEASTSEHGRPTPEGLHRDGVDYVLVLLVDRRNIASGVTGIHSLAGTPLGSFTLADALDAAIVDDRRVAHGVTPVEPIDPAEPAHRDVLVVTFVASSAEDHEKPT
jgi:hypothetical protein